MTTRKRKRIGALCESQIMAPYVGCREEDMAQQLIKLSDLTRSRNIYIVDTTDI